MLIDSAEKKVENLYIIFLSDYILLVYPLHNNTVTMSRRKIADLSDMIEADEIDDGQYVDIPFVPNKDERSNYPFAKNWASGNRYSSTKSCKSENRYAKKIS